MRNIVKKFAPILALGLYISSAAPSNSQSYDRQTVIENGATATIPASLFDKIQSMQGKGQASASPTGKAPAPGLTFLQVLNVCSTQGCDTISNGQFATNITHKGSQVYAYVWEIGYGRGEIAKQGGALLTSAQQVAFNPVCLVGGSYTINCPSGYTVVGFRYVWNVGYWLSNGYAQSFTAQDTSINYPYNTLSTFLTIKYSK